MSQAIVVDQLSHSYLSGGTLVPILDNVQMCVNHGHSVALIGRSGSGKSTLLNLISGLEPIKDGNVVLNGQSITTLDDRRRTLLRGREIGFIYQAFNLIPTLSVSDNIALPLVLAGMHRSQRRDRLLAMLDAVELNGRGDDFPDRLSGGEQQRVAIARALIHRPSLILADEPTGNLDAASGSQVLAMLFNLVKEVDSALLLVTHSVEVAKRADSLQMLDKARIRAVTPEALTNSIVW